MQDPREVINYSKQLKNALKNVVKTRKEVTAVLDPHVVQERNSSLNNEMSALEQKFGYKANPNGCSIDNEAQDFLKLAKESYGVSLSLEFQKALKTKMNGDSASKKFSQRNNDKAYIPTTAFKKIKLTSDVKLSTNLRRRTAIQSLTTTSPQIQQVSEPAQAKQAKFDFRKHLQDNSLAEVLPPRFRNKSTRQSKTLHGSAVSRNESNDRSSIYKSARISSGGLIGNQLQKSHRITGAKLPSLPSHQVTQSVDQGNNTRATGGFEISPKGFEHLLSRNEQAQTLQIATRGSPQMMHQSLQFPTSTQKHKNVHLAPIESRNLNADLSNRTGYKSLRFQDSHDRDPSRLQATTMQAALQNLASKTATTMRQPTSPPSLSPNRTQQSLSQLSDQVDKERREKYKCDNSYHSRVQMKKSNHERSKKSLSQRSAEGAGPAFTRRESIRKFQKQDTVIQKAEHIKKKKARRRNSQLRKIARESRATLMQYAKQSNVLEQFAKDLKETTREDEFQDGDANDNNLGSQRSDSFNGSDTMVNFDSEMVSSPKRQNQHQQHRRRQSNTGFKTIGVLSAAHLLSQDSQSPASRNKQPMDQLHRTLQTHASRGVVPPQYPDEQAQGLGPFATVSDATILQSQQQQLSPSSTLRQVKKAMASGTFGRKKQSRHERMVQAEGLTVNALKNKYESEFKKRLIVSNQQVKTKKCGGFVEIIQPVATKNDIPFLFNERKVKTFNRYLESSEAQVPLPNSYIQNMLVQQDKEREASKSVTRSVFSSPVTSLNCGNSDSGADPRSHESSVEEGEATKTRKKNLRVKFGHQSSIPDGLKATHAAEVIRSPKAGGVDTMNRYCSIDSIQQLPMDAKIGTSELGRGGGGGLTFESATLKLPIQEASPNEESQNTYRRSNAMRHEKDANSSAFKTLAESMSRLTKAKTKLLNTTHQGEKSFVKASNVLLEPFSPLKRGQDTRALKQLRMPLNPLGVKQKDKNGEPVPKLITLPDFCRQRNIPFNQNEQRYYLKAKQDASKSNYTQVLTSYYNMVKLRHKPQPQAKKRLSPALKAQQQRATQRRKPPQPSEQQPGSLAQSFVSQSQVSAGPTAKLQQSRAIEPARQQQDGLVAKQSAIREEGVAKGEDLNDQDKASGVLSPSIRSSLKKKPGRSKKPPQQRSHKGVYSTLEATSSSHFSPKHPLSPLPSALQRQYNNSTNQPSQALVDEVLQAAASEERSLDKSFDRSSLMLMTGEEGSAGPDNTDGSNDDNLLRSQYQLQSQIERMAKIANCPIDVTSLKKRRQVIKRIRLSTLAKKNPNFKLSAYQTIHRAKLNERLLQTLQRNDVDRPKVIREKYEIFRKFEPNLINIPEVKRTVRDELKNRKQQKSHSYLDARLAYNELLELIHTRYEPKRKDQPSRAVEVSALDQKLISQEGLLRLPVELERRFLEVLHVIIEDSWELPPTGSHWLSLMDFLQAWRPESHLFGQDNALRDCFKFFYKVSELFGFEEDFLLRYFTLHQTLFDSQNQQQDNSLCTTQSPINDTQESSFQDLVTLYFNNSHESSQSIAARLNYQPQTQVNSQQFFTSTGGAGGGARAGSGARDQKQGLGHMTQLAQMQSQKTISSTMNIQETTGHTLAQVTPGKLLQSSHNMSSPRLLLASLGGHNLISESIAEEEDAGVGEKKYNYDRYLKD